jgi:ribonuclease HI
MSFEQDLPLAEVLQRYSAGPQSGVFTDGAARPNPGPGGWGFVWVQDGKILEQGFGAEENTTNNRMELRGLIEAFKQLPLDAEVTVHSDSELCVKSMNEWAPGWKAKGWKRKGGPIANLELVQELYELKCARKKVKLQWVKAHNGWLWNEYADSLATAWARGEL